MDLLEWLANRVRATYLSELREPRYWLRIVFWINEDEVGQFPLKEWEEFRDCLERYRQEIDGQKRNGKEVSG